MIEKEEHNPTAVARRRERHMANMRVARKVKRQLTASKKRQVINETRLLRTK